MHYRKAAFSSVACKLLYPAVHGVVVTDENYCLVSVSVSVCISLPFHRATTTLPVRAARFANSSLLSFFDHEPCVWRYLTLHKQKTMRRRRSLELIQATCYMLSLRRNEVLSENYML